MNTRTSRFNFFMLSMAFALAGPFARADIPPPDSCNALGSTCAVAGPNANEPGTCMKSTCHRGSSDGTVTSYDCLLCLAPADSGKPSSGRASGTGGATSAGGATSTGGAKTAEGKKDDGGCSVSHGATDGGVFAFGIGVSLLLLARRRR
jgi:MYXO-CTERM domain-containing protein